LRIADWELGVVRSLAHGLTLAYLVAVAGPEPGKPALDIAPDRWPDVSRVFAEAVALEGPARGAYLDRACGSDQALRNAVASMLAAHDEAGSFGEVAIAGEPATSRRLEPGRRLGQYRIDALIGVGGMGEVYRAHDTKLGRDVAVKVLPDSFAHDPDRRARFEDEARALAALNHPHVGAIYGIEDTSDVAALVLELVEGPTLDERLSAGPLATEEIVGIARQLAEGLEAAHDRGIVHRDLKPGNIKLTPDGNVKILDFGLAKAVVAPGRDPSTDSPVSPRQATRVGAIVGTAAYMSPEQARGLPVDKRTDIWAFGCVLFEMCTGSPAFAGETVSDTLQAVLEREPDWHAVAASTPRAITRLLRRCLTRDPKLRLRDIGEARIALATSDTPESTPHVTPRKTARRALVGALGLVALASSVGVGIYWAPPAPAPTQVRFHVLPPDGSVFQFHPAWPGFSVSPDGSQLAFVTDSTRSGGVPRIWRRAMGDIEAEPVPGTDGAFGVSWSPDGRSLAFFTDDALKRVDLPNGPAVTVSTIGRPARFSHASWGADEILFGSGSGTEIRSVPAAGGDPRLVVAANRSNHEVRVHFPWFLPDGRRFLYTARLDSGEGELRLREPDGTTRTIMRVSSNVQWVEPDIVVFAREGVLMGQRVDLKAWHPVGEPFTLAGEVEYFFTTSRALFSTSRNGTLAYHPGGDLQQLTWLDPHGNQAGTVGQAAEYFTQATRLSRDGAKLIVARLESGLGTADLWLLDLVRGTEQRLTSNRGTDLSPVWTSDERAIFYSADSPGTVPHLFRMNLTTGESTEVLPAGLQQNAADLMPGDRGLVYSAVTEIGGFDIFQKPLVPDGPPVPLVATPQSTWGVRLSPDGRAMSYISEGDARLDIHVSPLPVTSAPDVVAQGVASPPRWSTDGRFLYYVLDGHVMSVPVTTVPRLSVGTPRKLFSLSEPATLVDVSPDGRFLVSVPKVVAGSRPAIVATGAIGQQAP